MPKREGYTFLSWYKGDVVYDFNDIVTEDFTLVAKWKKNTYEITWDVAGKKFLEVYEYGDIPVFKYSTEKNSDEKYHYEFLNWDSEIKEVTKNFTYTALYKQILREYTITFVNEDGTVLSSKNYHYNDTVVEPADPTKASTAQYTYTFAGWDKEISTVTGETTYTATYSKTVNEYEITWIVDGITTKETYKYGTIPNFKGSTDKLADETYIYVFTGWDKGINIVTGKETYTAVYDKEYIEYKITFVNEDGTVLSSKNYHYNDTVVVPENPTKASTAQYTYTFAGWDKAVDKVMKETTYTATYSKTVNEYEITWIVDGITTKETYKYGDTPVFKGNTDKLADETYTYEFAGWDKGINTVTGKEIYTAVYNKEYIEYKITFVNEDGTVLSSKNYHYNDTVVVPETPTKASTAQYTYTFAGWDKEVSTVTEETTYTATYTEALREYKITFANDNGTVLSSKNYHYNDTVIIPTNPTKAPTAQYTYTFAGWDKKIKPVTEETTYTATYTKTVNEYEITWIVEEDNSEVKETYKYGDTPVFKQEKEGYLPSFSPSITEVTGNKTYTVKFNLVIDVNEILTQDLAALPSSSEYTVAPPQNNEVNVTLKKGWLGYPLIASFFEEALSIFGALSSNPHYESVTLHTVYPGQDKSLEPDLNLKDPKIDYTDTSLSSWSDGGCNADVADWIGYLVTGVANNAGGVALKTVKELIGKDITVTIKLADGYVNTDGSQYVVYDLNFL